MAANVRLADFRSLMKQSLVKGSSALSNTEFRQAMQHAAKKGLGKGFSKHEQIMKFLTKDASSNSKETMDAEHVKSFAKAMQKFMSAEGLQTLRGQAVEKSAAHRFDLTKLKPVGTDATNPEANQPSLYQRRAQISKLVQAARPPGSAAVSSAAGAKSAINPTPLNLTPQTSVARAALSTGGLQRVVSAREIGPASEAQTSVGRGTDSNVHLEDQAQTRAAGTDHPTPPNSLGVTESPASIDEAPTPTAPSTPAPPSEELPEPPAEELQI